MQLLERQIAHGLTSIHDTGSRLLGTFTRPQKSEHEIPWTRYGHILTLVDLEHEISVLDVKCDLQIRTNNPHLYKSNHNQLSCIWMYEWLGCMY